jgi:carbonic anhydrase
MSTSVTRLFANNRAWAAQQLARDPEFFSRLVALQKPEFLWIGCADSRVPANEIVGLAPGEMFVQRNVANVVAPDDTNCLSVVQYAVDVLQVRHIIVVGHYGCGGVLAALGPPLDLPLEGWLQHVRAVRRVHDDELKSLPTDDARARRLCELNVETGVRALARVPTVSDAWARGQNLTLHGWVYDLHDGLLRDRGVSVNRETA